MTAHKPKPFLDDEKRHAGIGRAFNANRNISKKNKDAVNRFLSYMTAKGRSKRRIFKLTSNTHTILRQFTTKDFKLESAGMKELMELVSKIEASEYSPATKSDFKTILKQLYRYFEIEKDQAAAEKEGRPYHEKMTPYPAKVMFFETTIKQAKTKQPEDLITRPELDRMKAACKNPRDEAIISMLYESGARIGEFGEMRIKHIVFNEDGYQLKITKGKTGPRTLQQIESEKEIRAWLDKHPERDNSDAYLWVHIIERPGERMAYDTIRMTLKQKAARAGVDPRKVNPHNFRHTRATELAGKLTEAQMCLYFGWVLGSKMVRTYVHMSMRDLQDAYARIYGLKKGEKEEQAELVCPTCKKRNRAGASCCDRCGRALNTKEAIKSKKRSIMLDALSDMLEETGRDTISVKELKERYHRELEAAGLNDQQT